MAIFLGSPASSVARSTAFYRGKTITIIEGREPGGTGAMRVQAAIPFLKKYIPGEPTIVSQFMPGGGGRKASNYIYRNVPEAQEQSIKGLPREVDVIDVFKTIAGNQALPPR